MILEYIKLLETTEIEQCFENYFEGDKCCAIGVAMKEWDIETDCEKFEEMIGELYDCGCVIQMNDKYKMTFKEIAAELRREYDSRIHQTT